VNAALRHRGRQVRAALDGRLVPSHLIGNAPNPPTLKVNFSQHSELNVKFQSHRSRRARAGTTPAPLQLCGAASPAHARRRRPRRDYTNASLPAAPSVDPSFAPAAGRLGAAAGMPLESNVLLCGVRGPARIGRGVLRPATWRRARPSAAPLRRSTTRPTLSRWTRCTRYSRRTALCRRSPSSTRMAPARRALLGRADWLPAAGSRRADEPAAGAQALVQYPDPGSAANAKAALEGHAIYDGGYNRVRPQRPRACRARQRARGLTACSRARS